MITLYDYETRLAGKTISPWAMKVRLALNYKSLPHKTIWFGPFNIEERAKSLGLPLNSSEKNPDGTLGRYKIPILHDPSTSQTIVDSARILQYLDTAYPDTPRIVNPETKILAIGFEDRLMKDIVIHVYPMVGGRVARFMEPEDEVIYKTRIGAMLRLNVDELLSSPSLVDQRWKHAEQGLSALASHFTSAELVYGPEAEGVKGGFLAGSKPGLADFSLAAMLIWMKRGLGEDDERWKEVEGWNDGRWAKYLDAFKPYTEIHE
ncbi:hypothetical protein NMY22_g7106 [Coprinellus aureogranulatus]|nr:hypothetical protein NMY22_g7106 [Coprinellus aureogranulatus]